MSRETIDIKFKILQRDLNVTAQNIDFSFYFWRSFYYCWIDLAFFAG